MLTGRQKAAMLLMSLDATTAAELLKGIDSEEYEEARGKAEIIIGKQRNGPVGHVDVSFEEKYANFGNLDLIHSEEPGF